MANDNTSYERTGNQGPTTVEWGVDYLVCTDTPLIDEALALYRATGELHSPNITAPRWMVRQIFLLPDGTRVQMDMDLKSGEDVAAENTPDRLSLPWEDLTGPVMPGGDRSKALDAPLLELTGSWWRPASGTEPDKPRFRAVISSRITPEKVFVPVPLAQYPDNNDGAVTLTDTGMFIWAGDESQLDRLPATLAPTEDDFRHTLSVRFVPVPETPPQS